MTIRCEKCGSRGLVVDSRTRPGSTAVWRLRKCKRCGFRWSTIEVQSAKQGPASFLEGART